MPRTTHRPRGYHQERHRHDPGRTGIEERVGDSGGRRRRIRVTASGTGAKTNLPIGRNLKSFPLLRPEQEVELAQRVQAAADLPWNASLDLTATKSDALADAIAARNELVASNVRLVIAIARGGNYANRGLDLEDLVQAGCVGLIRAAEKFDPDVGTKFSTYAVWWISQSIDRALADTGRAIRIPVHAHEQIQKVKGIAFEVERDTGFPPSVAELAERVGMKRSSLVSLLNMSRSLTSLSQTLGDDDDFTVADLIPGDPDRVSKAAERAALRRTLANVLLTLPDRQRGIIELRFGLTGEEPKTLEEIGKVYSLTRERIRQLEEKAMAALRHPHRSTPLRGYLYDDSVFDD